MPSFLTGKFYLQKIYQFSKSNKKVVLISALGVINVAQMSVMVSSSDFVNVAHSLVIISVSDLVNLVERFWIFSASDIINMIHKLGISVHLILLI